MTMSPATQDLIESAVRGVAQIKQSDRGLTLHRLPDSTAHYHDHDAMTQKVADQASGARLALITRATTITLTYRSTRDALIDGSWRSSPSVVVLTGAGEPQAVSADNGDLRLWNGDVHVSTTKGQDSVAVFTLEPTATPRVVELWLPHNCVIEIINLEADAPLMAAPRSQPKWVHYGSSISHGAEADQPIGTWPAVVARNLGLDLFSLGLAGSANLELFVAQVMAGLPADLITLKLGINTVNGSHLTRRVFIPAVHSFLDALRITHPTIPLVVISPIYCPAHETNPGPTQGGINGKIGSLPDRDEPWVGNLTLEMIRELLQRIVVRREDPHLHYLNGLEVFGPGDVALLPDGLHPNSEGQALMGRRVTELLLPFLPKRS